jgi:hypothetical protein
LRLLGSGRLSWIIQDPVGEWVAQLRMQVLDICRSVAGLSGLGLGAISCFGNVIAHSAKNRSSAIGLGYPAGHVSVESASKTGLSPRVAGRRLRAFNPRGAARRRTRR